MNQSTSRPPTNESRAARAPAPNAEPRRFPFERLSEGAREVLIEYNSQTYRLRVTKNGKLILNK